MKKIDEIREFNGMLNGSLSLDVWAIHYIPGMGKMPAYVNLVDGNDNVWRSWPIKDFPLPKNYEDMDAEEAENYLRGLI